ncbi:MAG: ABC transporter ATP-binding protein [Methanoregula sp.]|jgi:lipopolysaccharide transport system ATP-binding protein|uniref:ABC transporter ATP-binding protein n=1 Tax=Methanoregula sp. TaxID=2052170 RepID=UPI003C149698
MSNNIAIQVRDLGKRYTTGGSPEKYHTFRDAIVNSVKAPFRRLNRQGADRSADKFWALKDVSFDVHQGEVVGIIGRNGAGKSTLLKILSRITTPTEGGVDIYGRIGSLLEVGTGFHPELTGRENIFLNGSILGMKKSEIEEKFDEIIKFSEIDKFIDTPVKRYSSGMYVRLAFAVAAHLNPEILIVDEVLAVGDTGFQKKCLGKMGEISKQGKTVLFVSHNMAAVSALCSKAMVLNHGSIIYPMGDTDEAIKYYIDSISQKSLTDLTERKDRQGEGKIRITGFLILDKDGNRQVVLVSGQWVEFQIQYECISEKKFNHVRSDISISLTSGRFITLLSNTFSSELFDQIAKKGHFSCIIKKLPLSTGEYFFNLQIRQNELIQDWILEAVRISVVSGDFFGTGKLPPSSHSGALFEQQWKYLE